LIGWKSILQHALNSVSDVFVIAMAGVPEISDLNQSGVDVCLQKPLVDNDVRRAITETSEDGVLRDQDRPARRVYAK
jgi:hypothetical protein